MLKKNVPWVNVNMSYVGQMDIRSPLHDLDLPGREDRLPDVIGLPHVADWKPHNLHDLAHVSWYYTCPAQHLKAAG